MNYENVLQMFLISFLCLTLDANLQKIHTSCTSYR